MSLELLYKNLINITKPERTRLREDLIEFINYARSEEIDQTITPTSDGIAASQAVIDYVAANSGLDNISDDTANSLLLGNVSESGDINMTAQGSDPNINIIVIPKGNGVLRASSNHTSNISGNDDVITKGYADNNYATLVGGVIDASQLPSYVDDVLEYADFSSFPVTGETGKIYVAIDTGIIYRWSGSIYVNLGNPIDISNPGNDRLITSNGDGTYNAEANLTFDGTYLDTPRLSTSDNGNVSNPAISIGGGNNGFLLSAGQPGIVANGVLAATISNSLGVNTNVGFSISNSLIINSSRELLNVSSADIDNINIDGNTISSTDTNGNINITPDGTGSVVIDGLNYPKSDGTSGQVLTTDGAGNLTFNDASVTTLSTTALQVDNINIDGNTISSTDTNGDINLSPDGTGSVIVSTDLSIVGDISRGVDNSSLTISGGISGSDGALIQLNGSNAVAANDLIFKYGSTETARYDYSNLRWHYLTDLLVQNNLQVTGSLNLSNSSIGSEKLLVDGDAIFNGEATFGNGSTGLHQTSISDETIADGETRRFSVYATHNGNLRTAQFGVRTHSGITNAVGYIFLETENGNNNLLWFDNSNNLRTSTSSSNVGTTGGTVIGTQTSDERLKSNMRELPYGLEEILTLPTYQYEKDGKTEIGFGAQSTLPIIPEAVYDTNEEIEGYEGDQTKYAMDYSRIIPVLVESIKELNAKIKLLELKIKELENE